MQFTNLPTEIFDYNAIRQLVIDTVEVIDIPPSLQNQITHTKWDEIFSLVALGMEVSGAKLYSVELPWNTVKSIEVPSTWPDWSVTEEGVARAKKIYEYTRVVRSVIDPTKCMLRFAKFLGAGIPIVDNVYVNYNYASLTHDLLMKYMTLFSDQFSSRDEAIAWRDINVPTGG